jgi:hypothetical protein
LLLELGFWIIDLWDSEIKLRVEFLQSEAVELRVYVVVDSRQVGLCVRTGPVLPMRDLLGAEPHEAVVS